MHSLHNHFNHPSVIEAISKSLEDLPHVVIYTDGACSGNPGPGGWGAVLLFNDLSEDIFGGERATTNNRMEMIAAIEALKILPKPCQVDLYTDSTYVRDGLNTWIKGWKKNGWMTASKTPVKNKDLWQALDQLKDQHKVTWHWVKGHAGNVYNERADDLARSAIVTQTFKNE